MMIKETLIKQHRPQFEPLLTSAEAARLLSIHPVTLLRWAREGSVPHRKLGRKVVFRASELNSWYATSYTKSAVRAAQP
jgi:excisionase family DNA binding protein